MISFLAFLLTLITPCVILILMKISHDNEKRRKSLKHRHVVITGGSSGIGKSVAIRAAKLGAHVTIIARDLAKLKEAEEVIKSYCVSDQQIVSSVSADVCHYEEIKDRLKEINKLIAPIYMLVNCAGLAICGQVEDMSIESAKKMMDVNYYGSYHCVKAVVPEMKERKDGIIVLVGSELSLLGIFGYSAYAASKFALRGLAEALDMELKPHKIKVTLAVPPDTNTPGLKEESNTKSKTSALITSSGGLYEPDDVAGGIMEDALQGRFFSYMGVNGFFLSSACSGMAPNNCVVSLIMKSFLAGPLMLLGSYYLKKFHGIVQAHSDVK